MAFTKYTKADLEKIVCTQLENLDAMHDLIAILKFQNELLSKVNEKLNLEISGDKAIRYPVNKRIRKSA